MKRKAIIVIIGLLLVSTAIYYVVHKMNQRAQKTDDKTNETYVGTNLELEGIEGRICSYQEKNGKLYLLTEQEENVSTEGEIEKFYQIYLLNSEENNLQPVSIEESENVVAFCVDENGNVIYISEDNSEENQIVNLVKIDKAGNELARQNLEQIVPNANIYLCGMVANQNGEIVLACGEGVYFFDEQLQENGKVEPQEGENVVDIALAKTGELVCVTDQISSAEISTKVYLLDSVKKQWGDELSIKLDMTGQSDYIIDGCEYDFYFKGSRGINGYNIATEETTEIINYDASYMSNADADGIICVGEGNFIGKTESIVDNKIHLTLVSYVKKTTDSDKEKQIITLGTMYANENLKSAVAKFNRSNSEYQVVIEDYGDMDINRLLADFATGNGQDIIDLASFPLSIEQCISKGLLEDLTPYYEKDSEITSNDLVAAVRETMEYDGKLYYVTPSFSVKTIAAKTQNVGDVHGWTVSELKNVLDAKEIDLFENKEIKDTLLWELVYYNISDYVDWKTGTCTFDSEEFKYLLELCNEKGLQEEINESMAEIEEGVNSKYSRFQKGEYLLLKEEDIDLRMIQFERKAIEDKITYIGYPNKEKNGSMFSFDSQYAISAQSELKEQSWEFVRSFLSKEYQKSIDDSSDMPVVQAMFDSKIKEMTATEAYTDEFGERIEPIEEYSMVWGDIEVQIGVPTQKDIDVYIDLINQTKRCAGGDMVIFNMIMEESADYFSGKKSLDKTADIIQKRVTTYVNEQR